MNDEIITIEVFGRVGGAGSKKTYPIKKKDGSIGVAVAPDSKYQKPFMDNVRFTFLQSAWGRMPLWIGAISFSAIFFLPRPNSHYKKNGQLSKEGLRHPFPDKRSAPDLDKAVRAAKDALSGLCYKDDKQVVQQKAEWQWRERPGAIITIERLFNPEAKNLF